MPGWTQGAVADKRYGMDHPTCPAAAPTFDIRDALSLRALQHVFPRETVDRIIAASGRKEERVRLLP